MPKDQVKKAVQESFPTLFNLRGLNLLPLPAELNFPAGMHPVMVTVGSANDVRQDGLQLATGLMLATTMVPYIGIGDSQTPLNIPLISYIAGIDTITQSYVQGLIPSVVGKYNTQGLLVFPNRSF